MDIFNIVWPVLAIFMVGFIAQRLLNIELAPLSTFSIYLLVPFLAFRTFYQEGINAEIVYYASFVGALCLLLVLISYCFSYFWYKDKEKHYGFILSSAFMNNGNFGVPLVLAIFGEQALNIAVMLMVLQQLLMSSVGVYFAAKGSSMEAAGGQNVIWKVLKLPLLYVALLGFIFNSTSITLPGELRAELIR
ncbi:AEC family transporter [Marinococcus halophilus]|uniref:AEC family transporter n=1 Tax=Marinococcus halophilus TaxID=1371 RepID=UPI003613CDC4